MLSWTSPLPPPRSRTGRLNSASQRLGRDHSPVLPILSLVLPSQRLPQGSSPVRGTQRRSLCQSLHLKRPGNLIPARVWLHHLGFRGVVSVWGQDLRAQRHLSNGGLQSLPSHLFSREQAMPSPGIARGSLDFNASIVCFVFAQLKAVGLTPTQNCTGQCPVHRGRTC